MPKGTCLNDKEMAFIDALKGDISIRKIKSKMGESQDADISSRSINVISQYIKKGREGYLHGRKNAGRKPKLTARTRRMAARKMKDGNSVQQVSEELGIPKSTVHRTLACQHIKFLLYVKRPYLTQNHKDKRLNYAREQLADRERDWRKVVFTDEKVFTLEKFVHNGEWVCVYDPRTIIQKGCRKYSGGKGVMVWGAFGDGKALALAQLEGRVNSRKYIEMLDREYTPVQDADYHLLQDGATIHTSKMTREYLESELIVTVPHPANSPDLNPIENLWAILAHRVYKGGKKKYQNRDELWAAIEEEWGRLDRELLHELADSMPKRLIEVIEKRGGHTKY